MRVERWFAFVDLSGFTSFGDEYGDDESVRVLTLFRPRRAQGRDRLRCAHREVARRRLHARVGRSPNSSSRRVCTLERMVDEAELPLQMHAGMAGGAVILLEGDDYTGGSRQPRGAADGRGRPARDLRAAPSSPPYAPDGTPVEPAG